MVLYQKTGRSPENALFLSIDIEPLYLWKLSENFNKLQLYNFTGLIILPEPVLRRLFLQQV